MDILNSHKVRKKRGKNCFVVANEMCSTSMQTWISDQSSEARSGSGLDLSLRSKAVR
jgi:hypothetical protein